MDDVNCLIASITALDQLIEGLSRQTYPALDARNVESLVTQKEP